MSAQYLQRENSLIKKLKTALDERNITIYRLSKQLNMKYELLRRVFGGKRNLLADELILILEVTGISIEEVK